MHNDRNQLMRALNNQYALNNVMRASMAEGPLAENLDWCLEAVFSTPWLGKSAKGLIYLWQEETETLVLAGSYNLSGQQCRHCASVSLGDCCCSQVVTTKKIQFTLGCDNCDEACFKGHTSHGFYNVPILDEAENILGVFTLCLQNGYKKNADEEQFLTNTASLLAALIKRKQSEEEAKIRLLELTHIKQTLDQHSIVAITNTCGEITYVNEKFCELSGYRSEELIGQNHRILNSGFHPKSFFRKMYRTICNGNSWHGLLRNRAKDGTFYWVDTTITPIKNAKGQIKQYIVIRTNITCRIRAEEVLQKNVDILNTTFDSFPGGIAVFNKDLILQAANPAFYDLRGLPAEKFQIGKPLEGIIKFEVMCGEYGDGDIDTLIARQVEQAGKFSKHTLKRVTQQGKTLEINGWPLPDGGFISTCRDITESEYILATLEEKSREAVASADNLHRAKEIQDKTYRHLINSVNLMHNGFVIWNADDHLVLANEAYLDFHRPIRNMIVEGVQFEDMLSAGLDSNIWDLNGQDRDEWLHQQITRRWTEQSERELKLTDGRQVIFSDIVLDNGDVISTISDITAHRLREKDLQQARDQLEQIAYFDSLTKLANRAHCQKDMAERFAVADPNKKFAIILIDLDNFKRVNDTMGHAAGDHLLKALGERLNFLAGEFDQYRFYRWGGDEFIALVERDADTDLDAICAELTDVISVPLSYKKHILRPTVSLGAARYPEDAQDIESLMIFSDLALYRTKELGRDGYQFFTSELKDRIDRESRIEQELRLAIEHDQLELYYQPQIGIDDEVITGIEALIRWNHPERGLVGPGEFLAISEVTGLAAAIGCKVFQYAMVAIRGWVDEGLEFGRLAVNLSPEHLKKNSILDDFFGAMEKYDIKPDFLAVEFLESFIFDDPDANVLDTLEQFRAHKIHVELDDFGTGYASLSHLSTMPITGFKIDKSFIDQIIADRRQQGIVEALISISKLMKLRVVCEGIETWQQVEALAQIGKCSIQGYFIARPMNFEDTTNWIKNYSNNGALKTWSNFNKSNTGNLSVIK